ncbi:MAG TPA: acyl-CoA dehydrogenase [Kineosporiaceae bacterium]
MPIAITDDQRAVQDSLRRWAERALPRGLTRGLEPDGRPGDRQLGQQLEQLWADLAGLGLFGMALPDDVDGAGGSVTDLAAALEQVGADGVPGPVLPTLAAALALAPFRRLPGVAEALARIAAGTASVALDLTGVPSSAVAIPVEDGGLEVTGRAAAVLGAGATSHLLLGANGPDGEVWCLLDADHAGLSVRARTPLDFSCPLADVQLDRVVVPAGRWVADGRLTAGTVREVAAVLAAAEAAGVTGWCLRTAVDHARTRHQFGRPVGAFQAVKHLCAGMLGRAERACAAAWEAARALDEALPVARTGIGGTGTERVGVAGSGVGGDEFSLAVAVGASVALEAAVRNAKDCIQVLGGIGFTWEHDAHLYLRRAVALRQLLGGTAMWSARAARLALAGVRRQVRLESPPAAGAGAGVDADTRDVVRTRVARIAAEPPARQRSALAEAGYLVPEWPPPYGVGADAVLEHVVDDELDRAGVARPDLAVGRWAVATLLRSGTEAQRERFVAATLRGDLIWCQLFSEPEAGSDLASLRTRADRVAGGWRLTGQKVWTSLAADADWGICLARSDEAAPRHRGLTYFLVPMRGPGVLVLPLREITGRAVFNEVFLDGVFVPDECVVGEPGHGWRVARGTLESERVAIGRGPALGEAVERLVQVVGERGSADAPGTIERLGELVAEGLTLSVLDLRSALALMAGPGAGSAGAGPAVRKLLGVAHRQAVAEAALEALGVRGAMAEEEAAEAVHEFLLSRCLSIAGGTTQILLNVVAERELGLPRDDVHAGGHGCT